MSPNQWLAFAAWVFVPFAAFAQQKQSQYAPTDANAPVHAVNYASAFKSYRTASNEAQSPDKVWRFANDETGKLGGHAGQMKSAGGMPAAAPATSSGTSDAAENQRGAGDHGQHY